MNLAVTVFEMQNKTIPFSFPYLGCFETSATNKTASENLLIAKNTVAGILILVKKLLHLFAFIRHDRQTLTNYPREGLLSKKPTRGRRSKKISQESTRDHCALGPRTWMPSGKSHPDRRDNLPRSGLFWHIFCNQNNNNSNNPFFFRTWSTR